jgi:DNA-binding FadR family transcriptional regulator
METKSPQTVRGGRADGLLSLDAPPALPSLEPRPTSELVAEALRRHIRLGLYAPGDRLPTERELAEHFGVGRSTVRSAFRLLTSEGLAETRRGRSGGTAVLLEGGAWANHAPIEEFVREVEEHFELLLAIAPVFAAQAARNASPEQRALLVAEASRVATTVAEFRANSSRFLLALAQGSSNRFVVETIQQQLRTNQYLWLDYRWDEVEGEARLTEDAQRAIALAVVAEDEAKASELMRTHLLESLAGFRRALDRLEKRVANSDPG